MKKNLILLGLMTMTILSYGQYPNNEDGIYQDMLTPEYYNTSNGGAFRMEVNKYVHFVRLIPFQHPLEDAFGQVPTYAVPRGFGDGIGPGGTSEHHNAFDLHIGSNDSNVVMFASIDGVVSTYRDAPKYRDYLTITKNVEDSLGNVIGKISVLYGHIDLNLDSLDNRLLNGQYVNKGDTICKHLYSGTLGGAHLHFEIRYYRVTDVGNESYYNWNGFLEPSSGPWSYGYWDANIGYGFANPENHLNQSQLGIYPNEITNNVFIYPNPAVEYCNVNLNNPTNNSSTLILTDLNGKIIIRKTFMNTTQVNTSILNSGIYLLKIKTDNKTINRKIMIK